MAEVSTAICISKQESEFWSHPLGKWMQSCLEFPGLSWPSQKKQPISYVDLCNAAILNALLLYIDPRETNQNVSPCDHSDVSGRLKNLGTFIRNIHSFYQEVLCQLIVMPLPDLLTIARQPFPEGSGEEMKKVLLLLLGCAVQSDKKEEFIEKIKELELSLQHAIVEQIQRITNNAECVLNVQALELDPDDQVTTTVLHQLQRVVKERNTYAQTVLELSQEQESDSSSGGSLCNGDVCSRKLPEALQHDARSLSPTTAANERNHSALELADAKAKLRKARNELEEKTELVGELRDDLTVKDNEITRLQQEKIDLLREARSAKDYRDELDCLQQKVTKLDRLESENGKMREKLSEMEFFRSRVEELRQENHILLETRQVLEDQVESWKRRSQQQTESESKLLDSQRTIHELQSELRQGQDRVSELHDENARLEKECHASFEKCALLEKEIEAIRNPSTPRANLGSIGDQLNDSVHKKLLELELENQKLRSQMDDQRSSETTRETANALIQEVHLENDSLRAKIEDLKKQSLKDSRHSIELQEDKENLVKQRMELERTFSQIESGYQKDLDAERSKNQEMENSLQQLKSKFSEFQTETQRKVQVEAERKCDALKEEMEQIRNQKDDSWRENRNLSAQITRLKSELTESDQRALNLEEEKMKLENRLHTLDRENRCVDKEKLVLKEKLDAADLEFESARTRLVDLERDRQRLETLERRLETASSQLADSELEQKQLIQQLELETKKTSRLREDLIAERTKLGDLSGRIQSAVGIIGIGGMDLSAVDSQLIEKWQECQKELSDLKIKANGKESTMEELRNELARNKAELHGLRAKEREVMTRKNSESSSEGSRRIQELEVENRNIKEQVGILQERIRHLTNQLQLKENDNTRLRQEHSDLKIQMSAQQALQTENAKLQVSLRNLELQEDLMRSDNEELQKQCSNLEQQNQSLRKDFEQLQKLHSELLSDHEQLQMLHEQLNMDYETTRRENSELKTRFREHKGKEGQLSDLKEKSEKDRRKIEDLKALLSEERSEKEREFKTFAILQNEHSELKRAFDEIQCRCEVLKHDVEQFSKDGRGLKSDYQESRLKITQLEGQVSDLQDLLQRKDLEAHKLIHKCEMMSQLNSTLEEESKTLLRQMDTLIIQNQDLLQQALMDKEHHFAEEKELQEKLNALKRHKEKLEEKIMDHYKTMDSPNRKKDNFIQRAAKVFNTKNTTRKNSGQKGGTSSGDEVSADEGGFVAYKSLTLPNGNFSRDRLYSSLPRKTVAPNSVGYKSTPSVLSVSKDVNATVVTTPTSPRRFAENSNPTFGPRRASISTPGGTEEKQKEKLTKPSPFFGSVRKLWRLSLIQEEGGAPDTKSKNPRQQDSRRISLYENAGVAQSVANLSEVHRFDPPSVQRSNSAKFGRGLIPNHARWDMLEENDHITDKNTSSDNSSTRDEEVGNWFARNDRLRRSYDVTNRSRVGGTYSASPHRIGDNFVPENRVARARIRANSSDELEKNTSLFSQRKGSSSSEDLLRVASPGGANGIHIRSGSNSTQAESSLSSGTQSSDSSGRQHVTNGQPQGFPKEGKGRISWAGSERAVDVPGAVRTAPSPPKTRPPPCPPQYLKQGPTGLPPRCPVPLQSSTPKTPPLPPPRKYVVTRAPPPPYPSKPPGGGVQGSGSGSRPPPPPYPGKQVSADLNRFRPDLAAAETGMTSPPVAKKESANSNCLELFTPQKTSTPICDRNFSFSVVGATSSSSNGQSTTSEGGEKQSFHPGNNSMASSIANGNKFPLQEVESNGIKKRGGPKNSEARRHVISLYENLENVSDYLVNGQENTMRGEKMDLSTAETDLFVPGNEKKERDSTIWYEYGCV